jgi:nicotinate-nucleotide adenylyltransferase
MNVAVLGGSFDPPHAGHVLMAAYLGAVANFEQVLVVPVFEHAFHKALTPFEHRLCMCRLAFESLPFVEVSPLEATLKRPNYTLNTLRAIQRAHPSWSLRLAVGTDVLAETHKWHAFEDVTRLAPPFVFMRHGTQSSGKKTPLMPNISSTEIREHLAKAQPGVTDPMIEELVPASVRAYIEANKLYRNE